MAAVKPAVTAEEFLRLCGDGRRRELVQGEVVELAPASVEHGRVAGNVFFALKAFARSHGLGEVYTAETGFILARHPDTVRAPDVAFVRRDRLRGASGEGFFPGAPDLAVEVVSPTDLAGEVAKKVEEYLEAGTELIWVVYPQTRHVVVYRSGGQGRILGADAVLDGEHVMPGFTCLAADLFGP